MKLSYIFGMLMAIAFSNLAVAQQSLQVTPKMQSNMPESIKKAMTKISANKYNRTRTIAPSSVRSLKMQPQQDRNVNDRERVLTMMLARKNNAGEKPSATLARVQKNPSVAQSYLRLQSNSRPPVRIQKTESEKRAADKAASAAILTKFQRKKAEFRKP